MKKHLMKKELLSILSLSVALFAAALLYASDTGPGLTADEALKSLLDGNQRYRANQMTIRDTSTPSIREALATGQKPFAIILSCSDSRVPPEIIFDKGLGEIFVVRVAGNIPDPIVLGSIEYAAEHFNCPLIMVLGHKRCGAVMAAVESQGHPHGNIGAIIKTITPAVIQARKDARGAAESDLVESAIDNNIKLVAKSLITQSHGIRSLVDAGRLKIVKAKYDLDDGTVRLLEK
ncbi:MAG: carbonic anhydrase [Syntrophobacteraceae bacterium]|jgi:carbonic anhydrase